MCEIDFIQYNDNWRALIELPGSLTKDSVKPTERRSLGKPRHRLEENIRMYLTEIDVKEGNWNDYSRYGILESSCECIEPPGPINH